MTERFELKHHTGYTIIEDKTFRNERHRENYLALVKRNGFTVKSISHEHEHEKQIIRDLPDQYEH